MKTNKKAPADVGASRAGAQLNHQEQDKPKPAKCQMADMIKNIFRMPEDR